MDFKDLISGKKLFLLAIITEGMHCNADNEIKFLEDDDMWQQFQPAQGEPTDWLGNWHPLAEQLGSANGLVALSDISASMQVPLVHDLASLKHFLASYQKQLLLPIELPAIQRAFDHTCRH